ncbi:MAG: VacB/RNase II family 3'-5' exoribonuclease [Gammaproteobacteria bacterium]|nr:VacB/RNase II family 3'-5' exoribonuclease [Gammaproteobacteria bacterium]
MKTGPVSYGKLVGLLRNSPGLSKLLQSMERQGEVLKDSNGRYQIGNFGIGVNSEKKSVTGIAITESSRWFLLPLVQTESARIPISPEPGMRTGDIVTVDLPQLNYKKRSATVRSVFDATNESDRAVFALLQAYEVPHDESPNADERSFPESIDPQSVSDRMDLRSLPFVTIDGESAKDFDDAVFACREKENTWRLCVAIADVAHYVNPGDTIDTRARIRGNSVYFPDRVVPMLPEGLSNGICSLRPNEDRLAVVCDMMLGNDGLVSSYSFYEAVIRSTARLTYTEAFHICNGGSTSNPKTVIRSLRELYEVAKALRKAREIRGALDFTTRESTVKTKNGNPVDLELHSRNDAHNMIEEAMIAANVCAARFLHKHGCRALFRVHEGPDAKSISELRWNLQGSSLIKGGLDEEKPLFIKKLLDRIRSNSRTPWIWELLVLRSMKQAVYSFENVGHFGLALEEYLHFTSPIRRYADLFVHRLIKGLLKGDSVSELNSRINSELGDDLSVCERRSVEVTRRVDAWLKCALLKKSVGKTFLGHIVKVEDFGLFVELDRYFISGLVHVSELVGDFYENKHTELVGEATGTTYRMGDPIEVRLVAVDVELQRLDLVEANTSEVGHEFRKGKLSFRRERRNRR